ncbi:MAG: thiolase family protein [Planctomycetota bacterium]|nr:thiolase family protein [Planctomycetota bacterium]
MSHFSYIVSASRTPIGSFLGELGDFTAPQLGGIAIKSCLEKNGGDFSVDEVLMGNVLQGGIGQAPARQAALNAGLNIQTPCVTINKVCGSGLKTVMIADQVIRAGDATRLVAGGMESMSNAPHLTHALRKGSKLGDVQLLDGLVFDGLTCAFESCHMGNHAEHIARKYGVTREAQDQFAQQSQLRAAKAIEQSLFDEEIVPIKVADRKRGERLISRDECVRENTSLEGLSKLKPVFDCQGTVTAGNASTLSDGAAAVLVVDDKTAHQMDSAIKAKILGCFTSGTEPKDLFIAPVIAIRKLLEKTNTALEAIDYFEINEAFAAQMVACINELGVNPEKVNVNGGGISLGHPIGASGTRCLVTLLHLLQKNQAKLGLVSLCLGGGNAVAMLVENTRAS